MPAAVPPLSVVMPVFNKRAYLDESIGSILAQSFGDFEFVIVDDGSTDGSLDRLREWAGRDPRIRLVEGGGRSGPVESSNRAVAESSASLVARMDADDVAHPERLTRQMEVMAKEPGAVLCGTLFDMVDAAGRPLRDADYGRLLRRSRFAPFSHPTILFRRDAFERAGGYSPEAERWEDTDLYLRLAAIGRVFVVAEPLMTVRLSEASTRLTADPHQVDSAMDRMYRRVAGVRPRRHDKLHAEAFLTTGSIRLWQGRRPGLTRRLLRHAELKLNMGTARMLVWAAWADLSPGSLRLFLKALLRGRNTAARRKLDGTLWVEWKPAELQGRSA